MPVLFDSPEGSPSASSTVAEAASPAPLANARVLPVSVAAEAGASLGRAVCWAAGAASWAAPVCSRAAVPLGRSNSGRDLFSYFVCFIISPNCVVIQKYVAPSI